MEDIEAIFEKHNDEFLRFERIEKKLNGRPDLHAFLLLDSLIPGDRDMVSAAEHDEIWLDIDPAALADSGITESQIIDLVRCGVRVDDGSLCMFV